MVRNDRSRGAREVRRGKGRMRIIGTPLSNFGCATGVDGLPHESIVDDVQVVFFNVFLSSMCCDLQHDKCNHFFPRCFSADFPLCSNGHINCVTPTPGRGARTPLWTR